MDNRYTWEVVVTRLKELFTESFGKDAEKKVREIAKQEFPEESETIDQLSMDDVYHKLARKIGGEDVDRFHRFFGDKVFGVSLAALSISTLAGIIVIRGKQAKKRRKSNESQE